MAWKELLPAGQKFEFLAKCFSKETPKGLLSVVFSFFKAIKEKNVRHATLLFMTNALRIDFKNLDIGNDLYWLFFIYLLV